MRTPSRIPRMSSPGFRQQHQQSLFQLQADWTLCQKLSSKVKDEHPIQSDWWSQWQRGNGGSTCWHGHWSLSPNKQDDIQREGTTGQGTSRRRGFSLGLIRSAVVRHSSNKVYVFTQKSMTVHFYTQSITKRAEAIALLDSGATKNFLDLGYRCWLQLPIKCLVKSQPLFNINGTENKSGWLHFYTDLKVQTGP